MVAFYQEKNPEIIEASENNHYFFKAYIGEHQITLEKGDALYKIEPNERKAFLFRGPAKVDSETLSVVVRGYWPEEKMSTFKQMTTHPYINGCSTAQIFPPVRAGDPTLQFLHIPKGTSEQKHHIHSTARVVYILSGKGKCVIGTSASTKEYPLDAGTICILEPMTPHHFETDSDSFLEVIPFHIFSSTSNLEFNHPMYNGTHIID